MKGVIVGIDTINNEKVYRVIVFKQHGLNNWDLLKKMVVEKELIQAIKAKKLELINATVDGDKLKGTTGDLSRFNNKVNRPLVILSEIVTDDTGDIVGYKVANYDGAVKNITAKELLAYCNRVTERGGIPIQNGQYVIDRKNDKHFIRSYPGGDYIREVLERKRSEHAKQVKVDKKKNEKVLSKLEEIFTPEQINELRLGKKHGVDIRIYANPRFTPEQMKVIREALQDKLNAKLFADPEYSVDAMKFLRAELRYGVDISLYASPKYSLEQLSELSTGVISGVDISKYADPKLTPEQMAEIRIRLENNIWKDYDVKADKSWK